MIKIDLKSTPKGNNKCVLNGSIEVKGKESIIAKEIYAIIKDFEENVPEALEMAIGRLVSEMADELEEE